MPGRGRTRRAGLAATLLLAIGVTALLLIPTTGGADTDFRQYPGGKTVPNLGPGMTPDAAAAALRAEGDRQLSGGLRVRGDREPVVTRVGQNTLFRFGLEYGGVKLVSSSDYVAVVGPSGRLLASRLRGIPLSVDATAPTIDPATAVTVAAEHARTTLGQSGALTATTPELEIWVDQQHGRLSWSILVREQVGGSVRAATRYRVAAIGSPAVLSWEDAIRYQSTIHVDADVWQLSPNQPTIVTPLPDLPVTANGSVVTTDVNGDAVFPTLPSGAQVRANLRGPLASVRSAAGGSLIAAIAATGGNDTLHFEATTEFALAQTTAFYWTTYANRWVRGYLPFLDTAGTPLDAIEVVVNENIPCNAASDGQSLLFGRAAGPCNNMATGSIVVHEFGHALNGVLAGGFFDAAYTEGFGDALAALVTEQPCLGPGAFRTSETCFRDATEVTLWPVSSPDPHEVGKPYAQFAWALAISLGIDAAAEIVLGSAAAAPSSIPDAVRLAFVVADDDGLLGTCSPNQKMLEAAADSRNLPRPPDCRVAGDNRAPTAAPDTFVFTEDEGSRVVDLVANDFDPDGDPLVVTDVQQGLLGTLSCAPMPCRYTPGPDASGEETLTYTVIDTYGGSAAATVTIRITPVEDQLTISGPGDVQGPEGEPTPVSVAVSDPDGPPVTLRWFAGTETSPAPCTFADPFAAVTTMTCSHDGAFPFGVVVTQGADQIVGPVGIAEIVNTRPSVVITAPGAGSSFAEGVEVTVTASFEDGPTAGPHTCEISWGDGTTTPGVVGPGTCTGSHAYPVGSAGTRQIVVSVVDPGFAGGAASVSIEITPTGGPACTGEAGQTCLVVGAGTLGRTQPVLFEFTAWVRRGHPAGQMVLLDGGRWRFSTVAVRALTISGHTAVFSGAGSLNGRTGFSFDASISDNRRGPAHGTTPDTLRVVIRNAAGAVERIIEGEVTRGDIVIIE